MLGIKRPLCVSFGMANGKAMSPSTITDGTARKENNGSLFPNYHTYTWTGRWGSKSLSPSLRSLKIHSLREIESNPEARAVLAHSAWTRLKSLPRGQLDPILRIIDKDDNNSRSSRKSTKALPADSPTATSVPMHVSPIELEKEPMLLFGPLPVIEGKQRNDANNGRSTVEEVESNAKGGLHAFCRVTVDAFFDNDLFMTTKSFMKHAKGSFGLTVTSTLDVHRQMCLAARGQSVSSVECLRRDELFFLVLVLAH